MQTRLYKLETTEKFWSIPIMVWPQSANKLNLYKNDFGIEQNP